MLNSGYPTPNASYVPYSTKDADNQTDVRRITRASGESLPAINIITGDTVPTRTIQGEDGEYFVTDEHDAVNDTNVDAMLVDVHTVGGETSRVQWIRALAAFATTMMPSPHGYTTALYDNATAKCIDTSGTYFTCIDTFSATFNTFDMSLPEPTDLASAQASPNWNVEKGYKASVETELG